MEYDLAANGTGSRVLGSTRRSGAPYWRPMKPDDPVSWASSGCMVLASAVCESTNVPPLTTPWVGPGVGGAGGCWAGRAGAWHALSRRLPTSRSRATYPDIALGERSTPLTGAQGA